MRKAVEFFGGNIRIGVKCRYPERFLNICAGNNVEFWNFEERENELHITVNINGYKTLKKLQKTGEFTIVSSEKKGVPFFLLGIKKRYALLAGMILCFVSLFISSLFIWEIRVYGNETVSTDEILMNLEELGVSVGSFRFSYSQSYVSNEMLMRVPELSWMTVNIKGSHADVLVREETPAPDILDYETPSLVYAEKSGIITDMIVLEGSKVCDEGNTVLAGDVLITGKMESETANTRYVHAYGDVYARTWYELSACMPEKQLVKTYTGEEKTKNTIYIAGKPMKLYFSGGNHSDNYDKIIEENIWSVFGDTVLPVRTRKVTCAEYELKEKKLTEESASRILEEYLKNRLADEIDGGEIVSCQYDVKTENGLITVTLNAECVEEIGAVRNMTEKEMPMDIRDVGNTEDTAE